MIRYLACLVVAGGLAACGTVTRGTDEQVAFNSRPDGARAETSLGTACTTPCTLDVPRKKEFTVTMTKDGFESQTVRVRTRVAGAGAAGVAGNVLLGGVIGVGVDMATGAALDHDPNPVFVDFEAPENTSRTPDVPEAQGPYKPQGPQPPEAEPTPVS